MTYRDLLLGALTYPDATPDRAVRSGMALARRMGGACTLLALCVDIPEMHNRLANALMDFDRLTREAEARGAAAASHLRATAATAAGEAEVVLRLETKTVRLYEEGEALSAATRTRDLCLLPVGLQAPASRGIAEAVLFGSGRPLVIYPEAAEIVADTGFNSVVIAWDASARAGRAVADALPLIQAAGAVRILVGTGEKPSAAPGCAAPLLQHLQAHGVAAEIHERPVDSLSAEQALRDEVTAQAADLLVMGGFGHARLREFVLGGVTASILDAPPCPVLMSH